MKKGTIYIFFSTLLFSSMEIVLKTVSPDFNPVQLTLSRFFIGGLFLLPFALKTIHKKKLSISLKDILYFSLLGFICVVISMNFYQMAVINTKASVVGVLFSCNPIFVMFLAYFILREKINKFNVMSLILEILGILIIVNPFNTKISLTGICFTIFSAITFAAYGVLGKKKSLKFSSIVVTSLSFILGSIEMLALALVTKINFVANFLNSNNLGVFADIPLLSGYSSSNILYSIYIFIGVTGFGYVFYFKAMEETSANKASLIFFFKPILSPLFALLILKESIPFNMTIGVMSILLGSIINILPSIIKHNKIISTSQLYKV